MSQVGQQSDREDQDLIGFLRQLFVPIYMPSILFASGEGALIPVIALSAKNLGADLATAGMISGLLMIGVLIGDIPSGYAVTKWGEANAMKAAAVIAIAFSLLCFKAPNLILFAVGVLMIGISSATFNLARHSFLTQWTPTWFRARAMSLLGGTFRIGFFIGPLLSAAVLALAGLTYVYWINIVLCLVVLVMLMVMPDPETRLSQNLTRPTAHTTTPAATPTATVQDRQHESSTDSPDHPPRHRLALITHFGVLIRLGTAAGILQMLRASRQVILPLWGVQLDIPDARIALIVGIAGAVDLSLFYTSGQVMDRFGRRWAAVPVLLGLSLGHLMMPLATSEWGYVGIAILLSLANGVGSGIVMTLGSDLAARYEPDDMPAFLGSWRLFTDTGSAAGPLGISAVTALAGLPCAAVAIGCCGLLGAVMMHVHIPRFIGK